MLTNLTTRLTALGEHPQPATPAADQADDTLIAGSRPGGPGRGHLPPGTPATRPSPYGSARRHASAHEKRHHPRIKIRSPLRWSRRSKSLSVRVITIAVTARGALIWPR